MTRLFERGSKCCLLAATLLLALLVVAPVAAQTTQLTQTYNFEQPEITQVTIAGQTYSRVYLPDCENGGIADQPALPARGARLLIPMGMQVVDINVVGTQVVLGDGYIIEPVSRQIPLSSKDVKVEPPTKNPDIYASSLPFPGSLYEEIGPQAFRGYQILVMKLQPVQYIPATGQLSYYSDLTVIVDLVETGKTPALYRGLPKDRLQVASKIDNQATLASYPMPVDRGRGGFDMLIITTPALATAFQPLKDYHDTHGLATEIRTTDDIGSNQPGPVRDYIIDCYYNDGIDYVIIGGDDDVIPARNLYVDGTSDMPGDIYFSCLDGTWNNDNDSYWGEPNDGVGGSDVDMVAEVYVGRACAGTTTEATRFVNKTIWYLSGQHSCTQKVLLVGEYLGFGGIAEYGGNYLDELNGGSDEHGYTTVGFDPELFEIDTLYERDGSWSKTDLTNIINNEGLHILNHLGHGDTDYAMKLYNSDILNDVDNDDLIFVYSQTCLAGHLDGGDCWAEHMNIKIDGGAFAVIMNARYGYGQFNSTDGASQRFNREFWDAIFAEQKGELGRANSDSKEDNIYRVNDDYMRWCLYELNLFGDPSIFMRGACSDAGEALLDSPKYACEDTVGVSINDCGLNLDDGAIETALVSIDSDSETGVEQVMLTETAPASAKFEGTIAVSATNIAGVLLVAEGDTITLTYNDADDGTGTPAVVRATAVVDCTPPVISNIQVSDIEPRSAVVTFDADEIVRGTVYYGPSCDNLLYDSLGGYGNPAMVNVTGLQDASTYFFMVVAEDEAGNQVSDDNNGMCYMFTTPDIPDFFTEMFGGGNDLENLTLFFTPNGTVDYYAGCAEEIDELPTDPAGGTSLYITEDSYQHVTIGGGQTVSLYGTSYSSFYVCDNGYITFTGGDTDYTESLEDHFSMPRISPMFLDFSVDNASGQVSWKQEIDRVVVTYLNVPEYNTSNQNTFQVEMYFNGDIRVSYLGLDANAGLAGLSEGVGLDPDYYPSDLSNMGSCGPRPPTAVDGEVTTPANWPVTIDLVATDDGLPEPPTLDLIIGSLPEYGTLADPGAGAIDAVPYTLVSGGNQVIYTPDDWYMGDDYFQFYAFDGGVEPEGGNSNIAAIVVHVTAPAPEPQLSFTFDTDPGWTTEGEWEFGLPLGGGSHNDDPISGYTGNNVYGYNLAGDYVSNMPVYYLTSTAIDCSDLLLTELHFMRWLGVERTPYDHATVEISTDGGTWAQLWANGTTTIADTEWVEMVFDISEYADDAATVYLRWSMGPTDGGTTYPGWNIDDVAIWGVNTATPCPGDLDGDGDVDLSDLAALLANYGTTGGASYEDGDLDGDGDVDLSDLATLLAVYGTTC